MTRTILTSVLSVAAAVTLLALAALAPEALIAQPALPSEPTQAPIGPGLGALAVAGGAYALRKLRNRGVQAEDGLEPLTSQDRQKDNASLTDRDPSTL